MKWLTPALGGLLLLCASSAWAASPFAFQNWFYEADTCSTLTPATPYPSAYTALCLDRTTGVMYVWTGSAWSGLTSVSLTAPGPIGGGTPSTGAFTTLSTTGAITAGGAVAVTGAISATTSVTGATGVFTGSGDKTVNISNGGHLSNPIGTGAAPTTGTGSVVAGGTDTAMRVTGGTSPVTVTFGTAFAVAPVCVCSNGSTAAHGCATSSEGTTSVVVTTASTDTFRCTVLANKERRSLRKTFYAL